MRMLTSTEIDALIVQRQSLAKVIVDSRHAARLRKEAKVPVERLRLLLDLDESTGNLKWKLADHVQDCRGGHRRHPDNPVRETKQGYLTITVDGCVFLRHRVVWAMINGTWPKDQIDHIDRNKSNNAPNNLRETSNRENHANRSDNTSGTVGVVFEKARQQWKAYLRVGYVMHNIGRFPTKEAAESARARYLERVLCLGY